MAKQCVLLKKVGVITSHLLPVVSHELGITITQNNPGTKGALVEFLFQIGTIKRLSKMRISIIQTLTVTVKLKLQLRVCKVFVT